MEDSRKVLADLNEATDQILTAFQNLDNWGPSGQRSDQYNSDVVADKAATKSLLPAGYRILSEESENLDEKV